MQEPKRMPLKGAKKEKIRKIHVQMEIPNAKVKIVSLRERGNSVSSNNTRTS